MRIKSLKCLNLRAIPDGIHAFGDGDEPPEVVVVTGPSGSGKTLLLETLVASKEAAAPYGGTPNVAPLIRYGFNAAKLTVDWWLNPAELHFAGVSVPVQPCEVAFRLGALPEADGDPGLLAVLDRYEHKPDIGKVDYFPIHRFFEPDSFFGGNLVSEQKFLRLSNEARKYRGILRFCREIVLGQQRERLERVQKLFAALTGGAATFGGLDGVGQPDFALASGEHVGHDALSASVKQAFTFAATMVMVELHNSIIFVDTPELYLPAGEAARRIGILREHAPTTQWILATTDPDVIALASKEAVIRLGQDSTAKEGGAETQ